MLNVIDPAHGHLFAGAAPCWGVIPEEVVAQHCQSALGTRDVHLIFTVDQHHVFYLCIPSRQVDPVAGFQTMLALALPGHRLHRGDGVYRINHQGVSHACVKAGQSLRFLSNLEEVMDDYISGLGLPVHVLTQDVTERLQRIDDIYRFEFDRLNKPMQWLGVAGIVIATLAVSGAKLYEATRISVPDYVTPVVKRAEALSKELVTAQPVVSTLNRFDLISTTVIRAGGWIDYFEIDASGNESFKVMFPEWVSQDYIKALGPQVVTDRDEPGLIRAVKGNRKP